ncbi:uncharacterized protein [Ptychodera flava]|uniref:uncharacterized protein n=1 Tax=Ptychodera flava TaxID=63121 RepID=UPI00396A1889
MTARSVQLLQTWTPKLTSTEHPSHPRRILLKTAKIRASYRGKEAIANVLFDEGADQSFVTKRFAKSLNANVHNTERLKLKSFTNLQADYTSVPATLLQLHTRYGKRILIDLLCVEGICNVTSEIANLRYLQGLPLAHPISDESVISIDILIGADRYWDFIGNRVVRGPGPTANTSHDPELPCDIVYMYDRIISEQLESNYIEQVNEDDNTEGHYLPHRAVKRDSDTTPIRVVYDCSATGGLGQPSLNDCLDTGPSLLNGLTAILLRFRSNPVALTSDIEKAFLQIRLHPDDRKHTKFLWLSDVNDVNSDFVTYQFSSVLFGATCSPFILNATVKTLVMTILTCQLQLPINLRDDMYVDDVITGCRDTSEASTILQRREQTIRYSRF